MVQFCYYPQYHYTTTSAKSLFGAQVYRIVLGHSDSPHHWYPRGGGRSHKVSDDCARRGLYKLRKNETLWALLLESPREFFVDSLKVLDPSLA